MEYTIKPGDSLSKIARDQLGDINLWQELARINNISNPNLIQPGQVISLSIHAEANESDGKTLNLWPIFLIVVVMGALYFYLKS